MNNSSLDFPCPACGFLVFVEPPGSYDICPLCHWEDDHVQLKFPGMRGGANKESLGEAQINALKSFPIQILEAQVKMPKTFFSDEKIEPQIYHRDKSWRPLRAEECVPPDAAPRTGLDYFHAAGEDSPAYYWKVNKS